MKNKIFIFIMIFLLLTSFIFCEEKESLPRQMSLFIINKNIEKNELLLYTNSLIIKLEEDPDIRILEPVILQNLDLESKLLELKKLNSDSYLEVEFEKNKDELQITYSSYDVFQEKMLVENQSYKQKASIINLKNNLYGEILVFISENYEVLSSEQAMEEVKRISLEKKSNEIHQGIKAVVNGLPGTKIICLEQEYIIDDNGLAIIYVPRFTAQRISAYYPGYYPITKLFYIEDNPEEITLKQVPASIMAIDVFLQQLDYAGLNYSFYFIPNYVFAQLGCTYFGKKLIFPVEQEYKSQTEVPLLNVALSGGYYLNDADSLVRFSLKHGLFMRILFSQELGIRPEPLSSLGINIVAGNIEISPDNRLRFFAEYTIAAYLTADANVMKQAISNNDNGGSQAGYIFINPFVLDFLDFKIGVRLQI